jgi:hypothetical protein
MIMANDQQLSWPRVMAHKSLGAIPITLIRCANNESCVSGGAILQIRASRLDSEGRVLQPGQQQLDDGIWVSSARYAYCCHRCWVAFCDED